MSFQWWFYCVTNSFPGFLAKAIALDEHLSPVLRISFLRERYYLSKIWALSPFWSVLFLCIFPLISLFFPPTHSSFATFSYFIIFSLSYFRCLSALMLTGFPATGSLFACNGSPNCHALLFPLYSLGRHSAKSSISPHRYHFISFVPFFFLFFLFFKQLNWIMFALRIFALCFFFTLVSSLLRLIAGLYNTLSFVRLSVCRF